jgi:hypothetical protein
MFKLFPVDHFSIESHQHYRKVLMASQPILFRAATSKISRSTSDFALL